MRVKAGVEVPTPLVILIPLLGFIQAFRVPTDVIAADVRKAHILDETAVRVDTVNGDLLIVPILVAVTDGHGDFHQLAVVLGEIRIKTSVPVGLGITDRIPLTDLFNDVFGNRLYFRYQHDILPHFTISTF